MKVSPHAQQVLLLLAKLDQELTQLQYRSEHLPEYDQLNHLQQDHQHASTCHAELTITLSDIDTKIKRLDLEISAVVQRYDRDQRLLQSGTLEPKQLTDLQHEIQTLQHRQDTLENSLLDLMTQQETIQEQYDHQQHEIEQLLDQITHAQQRYEHAITELHTQQDHCRHQRQELLNTIDPALITLYERQRSNTGIGAGTLRGNQCGACRIEIDRGELSRICAAADDELTRCPECNVILIRTQTPAQ